jgi:16S rRNA (uracil1498-N3)-methyltransferase
MTIPRFYLKENIQQHNITITGQDARQLIHVLRFKKGDLFKVFDGSGKEYSVRAEHIGKDRIDGITIETSRPSTESSIHITLCQALPKGQKMDLIVQKATEIGVKEIRPVITARSLTSANSNKLERWGKIAKEALEQSGRVIPVEIHDPAPLEQVIKLINSEDLGLLFCAGKKNSPLKKLLHEYPHRGKIFIFIGPEGDFSEEEIEMSRSSVIHPASLGPRILRTETAGLVAAGIIFYELEA